MGLPVVQDELVAEAQARHEDTLFHPEDGTEGAREEDTFNGSKSDQTLSKGASLAGQPTHGPFALPLD